RRMLTFSTFGGPTHHAGLLVERKKLSLLFRRVTVDQPVAVNRRTHVHRDVRVLPDFARFPLAASLLQRVSVCALSCAGDDEMRAGPEWRRDVLVPFVRKRDSPQLFAGLAVDTNNR